MRLLSQRFHIVANLIPLCNWKFNLNESVTQSSFSTRSPGRRSMVLFALDISIHWRIIGFKFHLGSKNDWLRPNARKRQLGVAGALHYLAFECISVSASSPAIRSLVSAQPLPESCTLWEAHALLLFLTSLSWGECICSSNVAWPLSLSGTTVD